MKSQGRLSLGGMNTASTREGQGIIHTERRLQPEHYAAPGPAPLSPNLRSYAFLPVVNLRARSRLWCNDYGYSTTTNAASFAGGMEPCAITDWVATGNLQEVWSPVFVGWVSTPNFTRPTYDGVLAVQRCACIRIDFLTLYISPCLDSQNWRCMPCVDGNRWGIKCGRENQRFNVK